jgi:L-amino acid N-acyltransferase YncA
LSAQFLGTLGHRLGRRSHSVDPAHRGRGLGTRLARAARLLVPADAMLWAQIAPANAASVRAFLAAGFRPVGAEALFHPFPPAEAGAHS